MSALINPQTGEPFGLKRLTGDVGFAVYFFERDGALFCKLAAPVDGGRTIVIEAQGSSPPEAAARAVFAFFSPKPPARKEPEKPMVEA